MADEKQGNVNPKDIHSAGKIVDVPGDTLGPLERTQRGELKPGTLRKAMDFIKKDSPEARAKILGKRAAQAAAFRTQRQMADEDITEVAQKAIEDKKYSGTKPGHPNRMGGYRPQFGPREPKYIDIETKPPKQPKVSPASQMPKCEKADDNKTSPDHDAIAARAFGRHLPVQRTSFKHISLKPGTVKKCIDFVKARGIPSGSGQPPGPPPRPGLQWNSQTHRWVSSKLYDTHTRHLDNLQEGIDYKEDLETTGKPFTKLTNEQLIESAKYWKHGGGNTTKSKSAEVNDLRSAFCEINAKRLLIPLLHRQGKIRIVGASEKHMTQSGKQIKYKLEGMEGRSAYSVIGEAYRNL